jgi:hypothetical protein
MAKLDPDVVAHLEWLGFVQPTGLVVSAPALVRAGAILDRRDAEGQRLLRACLRGVPDDADRVLPDFVEFARRVLGWSFSPKGYAGTDEVPIPAELEVALPDYGETLRPDYAVSGCDPADGASPWQLLVVVSAEGEDFDAVAAGRGQLEASAHGRLERLLRETGVPAGLLFNGRALRLLSAPRGESSGWLQFDVAVMVETAGRPISTAMRVLLRESRLLTLPRKQRLAALLEDSRKFQNEVSEQLAVQVLHALYELLRGFQAAHDASGGELLRDPLADDPDDVYRALLTVILRLVFLLYAEERDMLPTEDETFGRYYSLAGLYERLRDHAAHFPDTMDQRYGAWAQLLVLFRMVHDGAVVGADRLPARRGVLFDPDRFRFLEGRSGSASRQVHERVEPPLVPDGTIFRALEKLLVLGGERLSYRALDVEQIGSVYETMMGFRLERAPGRSVAVRAAKRTGAPTAVDLEGLLAEAPGERGRWLADRADRKLTARVGAAVRGAASVEELHDALMPVVDVVATPDLVPHGAMVLQPSEERRRSGSHYTPRTLTEPIVRTTLEPVLTRLRGSDGASPRPEQVLDVKVCDPAMGSGAFLVESCRQLGDALIEAWRVHGGRPEIPPDEDEVVFARRLVAQRCLYGVDRNPIAVDLTKMSLWLATLAREHPLTFVDHALRHGDSLIGLSRRQIEAFHWDPAKDGFEAVRISEHLDRVRALRAQIREAGEDVSDAALRDMWDEAQFESRRLSLFGDLVVLAHFSGAKARERETARALFAHAVSEGSAEHLGGRVDQARDADPPLVPFHWEIEFPEVLERENGGFDAIVGNPPFMGGGKISSTQGDAYLAWLLTIHPTSHGNGDLVAHFFRRGFDLLRDDGTLGLIATNTIGQGDTRTTGLRWICTHRGEIYHARRRVKWPGTAVVVVSVVHLVKGPWIGSRLLDDRKVETITAFLFHRGGHETPTPLEANTRLSFTGMKIYGQGFTFDDTDTSGEVSSLADMRRLIAERPENEQVILPYIGGEEVNDTPTHAHHRYVISFFDRSEAECRDRWPDLMAIVEEKVRPERIRQKRKSLSDRWWQYGEKRPALTAAISGLDQILVCALHSKHLSFAFLPSRAIFSHALAVLPLETHAAFCALQSRSHEAWARFFGSSMKDDLRYTPSDCFETFPFPDDWEARPDLDGAGCAYYDFRAQLMVANDEGMTKTYNRFHDPDERSPEIAKLRELHAAMDRAVLDAYGWTDIPTDCEFLLDYEEEGEDEEGTRRRKKPWRYRWPNNVRDEVLARLLELNAQRAAEERRSGAAADASMRKRAARSAKFAPQTERLL